MRIYTLWEHDEDYLTLPWLVDAIDEYSLDEGLGGMLPKEYQEKRNRPTVKEVIIEVSDKGLVRAFVPPTVPGAIVGE